MKRVYFVEMTDTFGGEANYIWANHFKVTASTARGAMRKVVSETGYGPVRRVLDSGDMERWDVKGAAVCYFIYDYEEDQHGPEKYSKIKEL